MVARPYVRKRRTVYFGSGSKTVSRPCPRGDKLILGGGKKQKRRRSRKTRGKQKGGWASLVAVALPYTVDTIKSISSKMPRDALQQAA